MRKCITLLSGCILLGGTIAMSQSPSEEYNAFRRQILSDFANFKSRILEHYDDFLGGEWHEFETLLEEESPYTQPKPESFPEIDTNAIPPQEVAAQLPAPRISPCVLPGLNAPLPVGCLIQGGPDLSKTGLDNLKIDVSKLNGVSSPNIYGQVDGNLNTGGRDLSHIGEERMKIDVPEFGAATISGNAANPAVSAFIHKDMDGMSNYAKALMHIPDPEFAFGELPGQIKAPNPGESGLIALDMSGRIAEDHKKRIIEGSGYATEDTFKKPENRNVFNFDYYGMEAFIPEIEFNITASVKGPKDTPGHWKKMENQAGGRETARQLFGLARQLGLNGYLTFRLTEQYVNQRFKNSDSGARMSAVHFLLSNMGYDVRLVEYDNMLTVMMPFDQSKVYGMRSAKQNNGRTYTLLYPEWYREPANGGPSTIRACILPADAGGKTSDLRVTGLSLPFKGKSFSITNGDITISGEVNENIKKMFYHYPQMPCGDFASSWIDATLRDNIVDQIREQLAGKTQKEAINSLLGLCHYGFEYKTDQAWHIFEKPYFVEENFLYEFNDCEDRAIFMSYLVWNALGIPCQLIQYPGHESVTVAIDKDVNGYYYDTDGVKYFSADPTYIGSHVGMVMTNYRSTSPSIDKHYK